MNRLLILVGLLLPLCASSASPKINGIDIFPSDNAWNTPVDTLPAGRAIDVINDHGGHNFHPDFGTKSNELFNGIPVNVISGKNTPKVKVSVGNYWKDSDPLPGGDRQNGFLPIPVNVMIENDPVSAKTWTEGADHHLIIIDSDTNTLHELYSAIRKPDGSIATSWYGRWDLKSNALRPDFLTSGDAAGLPVTPGLVQYEQVKECLNADPKGDSCTLGHALRFTLDLTHGPHLWPARHDANSGGPNNPPFGLRVRLKASVDTSKYSPTNRIILNTLKKYGAILTDNGGDWFFQGSPDPRWNNDDLHLLSQIIPSEHFEVVDTSHWIVNPDSAQANLKGGGYTPPSWPNANHILALDFNDGGDTATGFKGFALNQYSPSVGYGWDNLNSMGARIRPSSQDLLYKSIHMTENATDVTFLVDIPNGTYSVTLFYGDPEYPSNDALTVFADGVQVMSIDGTSAGQKGFKTFVVKVSDSQINLLFHANGQIAIAGLEIDPQPK